MNGGIWRVPRVRRFPFSFQEGPLRYIAIGVLALIIVGSLLVAFYPRNRDEFGPPAWEGEMAYLCQSETCRREFRVQIDDDFRQKLNDSEMRWAMGKIVPRPCPDCDAEALPALICPKCGQWYVAEQVRLILEAHRQGRPTPPEVYTMTPTCPNCRTPYYSSDAPVPPRRRD